MSRTPLILTALLAAAIVPAAAHAREPGVTATYRAADNRYCVRATDADTAEFAGTRLYRRACLTERQWHQRGIHFDRPSRAPSAVRS